MSDTTSNRSYPYPESGDDPNVPADIEALAQALDADVQDAFDAIATHLAYPHTLLNMGTPSIANNSIQLIDATSAIWDPASQWTAGTPSRITVTKSGLWEIGIVLRFASQATAAGQRNARLYKNGAEEIQFGQPAATNYNATNIVCMGSTQTVMSSGDYIQGYAYQNSGGALSLTGNSRMWARFLQV